MTNYYGGKTIEESKRISFLSIFGSLLESKQMSSVEQAKEMAFEMVSELWKKYSEGTYTEKFLEIIDSISIGGSVDIESFESLSEEQNRILQAIKRAYKRSPMAKKVGEFKEEK